MELKATTTRRRPRADASRNRARLLEAAKVVLGAGGAQASLEAVAREAGVGIGTLYRHFPTRESLFEAVYRREVDLLSELAVRLAEEEAPVDALRRWLRANVAFVATKKGMATALALAAKPTSTLSDYSSHHLTAAISALLDRAVRSGQVRGDIGPQDLLRALVGICLLHDEPGWESSVHKLVEVLVDGLLVAPPTSGS